MTWQWQHHERFVRERFPGAPAQRSGQPSQKVLKDTNRMLMIKGLASHRNSKTNFHFSWQGFCHIQYFYLATSLPRKVKVSFRVAMASQPFQHLALLAFSICDLALLAFSICDGIFPSLLCALVCSFPAQSPSLSCRCCRHVCALGRDTHYTPPLCALHQVGEVVPPVQPVGGKVLPCFALVRRDQTCVYKYELGLGGTRGGGEGQGRDRWI